MMTRTKSHPIRYCRTGEAFGELTVIDEDGGRTKTGKRLVLCRCSCGRERLVQCSNLRAGSSRSCGYFPCSSRGDTQRAKHGFTEPGSQARRFIYSNYQSVAKQRGRAFEISFDDFVQLVSQPCYYCGAPPSNRTKDRNGNGVFVYTGLDRIDPERGYTLDNVAPACIYCNRAKTDMKADQFWDWIDRIVQRKEIIRHGDGDSSRH